MVPTIDAGQFQGEADAGKVVIDLATCLGPRGADDRRREADGGQAGHRADVPRSSTWQRAAVPVVPTCRPWCRSSTPASVPSPGKLVIDLASAGASPRRSPCRRSTPASSKGKSAIVPPVVPTIDGGRLTAGNSARRSSTWQAPGPSRGRARADDRRRETDAGQGGHRPGNVSRSPWCRRSTPASVPSPGKLVIDLASAGASPRRSPCRRSTPASFKGKPVIVPPVVPTCRACRRSTPAS